MIDYKLISPMHLTAVDIAISSDNVWHLNFRFCYQCSWSRKCV